MLPLVAIRLHGRGKTYQADPGNLLLHKGDPVVVERESGLDFAFCVEEMIAIPEEHLPRECYRIVRLANAEDEEQYERVCAEEQRAFRLARQKVEELGLDMRLVQTDVLLDRHRMLFYFTAESRVDFRELVKELAAIFRTRIELRQIGVRDEARLLGGLGCCGRELCCCSFLHHFHPVSIKMAKEQNLSMNPNKISGACGRLLCCLKFEQEAYEDARRRLPYKGDVVRTEQGEGTVENVNLLKETVLIRLDREDVADAITLPVSEITVLRSNRKKKATEKAESPCEHCACPQQRAMQADALEEATLVASAEPESLERLSEAAAGAGERATRARHNRRSAGEGDRRPRAERAAKAPGMEDGRGKRGGDERPWEAGERPKSQSSERRRQRDKRRDGNGEGAQGQQRRREPGKETSQGHKPNNSSAQRRSGSKRPFKKEPVRPDEASHLPEA